MPVNCECHIAAAFPDVSGYGIISATLRTNKAISIVATDCNPQIAITGAARGDLSITAYAPFHPSDDLKCPGNASISFGWDERLECDGFTTHFIPRTTNTAYMEGDVTEHINMVTVGNAYTTFNASAAGGPHTPYLYTDHYDGYNLEYTGSPITISVSDQKNPMTISFLSGILPTGSKLYLTSFNWSYTPPNIPTVSYSFLFSYAG
jgi:hypothetical protein